MRFTLLVLMAIGLHCNALGQNKKFVDSLILELKFNDNKVNQFKIARSIAHNHTNNKEGLHYANLAYSLAKELGNLEFQAKAFEAIATNQRLLGNKAEATEATLKALKIYESLNNVSAQAATYVQLGSNAVVDQAFEEAISFFNQSLTIYKNLTDSTSQTNHALALINLSEAYRLLGQMDQAHFWLTESLKQLEKVTISFDRAIVLSYATGNLGMVYNSLDSLELARDHLTQAIYLTRELGDPYTTSVYLADLGLVEQKEGNYSKAEQNLLDAYEMAVDESLKEQIRDISELLVSFYEHQGNFQSALTYQKVYQTYQDSLVNRENIQNVERIKANFEIDKRDSEIGLLNQINNQQRTLAIGLSTVLLLIIGFTVVIYRTNGRLKQRNQTILSQKEKLDQLNHTKNYLFSIVSHDLKSPVHLIQRNQQKTMELLEQHNILEAKESMLKGISASESMSNLLSNVLNWALDQNDQLIFLPEEHSVQFLVQTILDDFNFLALEKSIKIGCNFKHNLPDVFVDKELFKIAFRNLIENAIKYIPKDGNIVVEASEKKDFCLLTIQDSGPGIEPAIIYEVNTHGQLTIEKVKKSKGSGLGLFLSKTLILKNGGKFLLENVDSKGLKISISLPIANLT